LNDHLLTFPYCSPHIIHSLSLHYYGLKNSFYYLSQFSAFFDLKPQAIKVFGYVLNQLMPHKDEFVFFLDDCMEFTKYSKSSVFIGLGNLVENKIIARGRSDNFYYINPMVAFNGNRVTFAKSYVKKSKSIPNPNQLEMDF
jgi:hypothetical protein